MDLIIIYGPPASGKYTLASKLAKMKGYKFLHNHTIIDLATAVFDKTKPSFWTFCWKLRFEIVKEAINQNIKGLVLTIALSGTQNEIKSINKITKYVEKCGGDVKAIQLVCEFKELKKRVSNISRKRFGKIQTTGKLKEWYRNYNEIEIFPRSEVLILDTSKLSLKESNKKIIDFLSK